jgi:hypothetical protein
MRQRSNAAVSRTQTSSLVTTSAPRHWKSLSGNDAPHSNHASNWVGQSSTASWHSVRQPEQAIERAHKVSQSLAPFALLPPPPPEPPLPAEPAAALPPAEPPAALPPAEPPAPAVAPPPAPAPPPLPAAPPGPAAPLPAAPPLPALPPALPSPPPSSEQAGGKQRLSKGTSQAVRMLAT